MSVIITLAGLIRSMEDVIGFVDLEGDVTLCSEHEEDVLVCVESEKDAFFNVLTLSKMFLCVLIMKISLKLVFQSQL